MNFLRFFIFVLADRLNPFRRVRKLGDFLQNLNFVIGGVEIVRCWLHNLNSNISPVFKILGQPNSGEVTPSEFLNQDVPVDQYLSNVAGMVAANFIVLNAFIFTMILLIKLPNPIS